MDNGNDTSTSYFNHIISLFYNGHPDPSTASRGDSEENYLIGVIKLLIWMTITVTIIVKWILSTCDLVQEDDCETLTEDNARDLGPKRPVVNAEISTNGMVCITGGYRELRNSCHNSTANPLNHLPEELNSRSLDRNRHVHFADGNGKVLRPKALVPKTKSEIVEILKIEDEKLPPEEVDVDDYVIFDSETSSSGGESPENPKIQMKLETEMPQEPTEDNYVAEGDRDKKMLYVKCVADTCPKTVMKLIYEQKSDEGKGLGTEEGPKENSMERKKPLNYFIPLSNSAATSSFSPQLENHNDDFGTRDSHTFTERHRRHSGCTHDELRSPTFIAPLPLPQQPRHVDYRNSTANAGPPLPAQNRTHKGKANTDPGPKPFVQETTRTLESAEYEQPSDSAPSPVKQLITPYTESPFREEIEPTSAPDQDDGCQKIGVSPQHSAASLLNRKFGLEIVEHRRPSPSLDSPESKEIICSPTHSTSTTLSIELSPSTRETQHANRDPLLCQDRAAANVRRNLNFGSAEESSIGDCHISDLLLDSDEGLRPCQVYQVEAQSRAICTSGPRPPTGGVNDKGSEQTPCVANVRAYGENPFLALARATAHAATIASAKAAFDVKNSAGDMLEPRTPTPNSALSKDLSPSFPGHDQTDHVISSDLTILVSTSCTIRNIEPDKLVDVEAPGEKVDCKVSTYARAIHESLSGPDAVTNRSSPNGPIAKNATLPILTYQKGEVSAQGPEATHGGQYLINGSAFERVIKEMKRAEDQGNGYTVLAQNVVPTYPSHHVIKPILVKTNSNCRSSIDSCSGRHITLSSRVIEHEVPYEDRAGNWLPGPDSEDDEDETVSVSLPGISKASQATRTQIKLIDRAELSTEGEEHKPPSHSIHSHHPPLDEIAKHRHSPLSESHGAKETQLSQNEDQSFGGHRVSQLETEATLATNVENKPFLVPSKSNGSLPKGDDPKAKAKASGNKYSNLLHNRSSSDGNVTSHLSKIWEKIPKRNSASGKGSSQKITKPTTSPPEIPKPDQSPKTSSTPPNHRQQHSNLQTIVRGDLVKESPIQTPINLPEGEKKLCSKPPLPNGHIPKTAHDTARFDGQEAESESRPVGPVVQVPRYRDIVSPSKALINKLKNKYMTPSPLAGGVNARSECSEGGSKNDDGGDTGLGFHEMAAFDRAIRRYRSHSRSSLTSESGTIAARNQLFASHPAMRSLLSKSLGDLSNAHSWASAGVTTTFNKLPSPSNPAISEAHKAFDRLFQASMTKLNTTTTRARRATTQGSGAIDQWEASGTSPPISSTQRSMSMGSVLLLTNPTSDTNEEPVHKIVGETDIDQIFADVRRESDALKAIITTPTNNNPAIDIIPVGDDPRSRVRYGGSTNETGDSTNPSKETMALLARLKDSTSTLDLPSWMSRSSLSSYQEHCREDSAHRRPFSRTSLILGSGDESGVAEMQGDANDNGKRRVRYRSGDFRKVDLSFSDSSSCLDTQSNGNNKDSSYEPDADVFNDVGLKPPHDPQCNHYKLESPQPTSIRVREYSTRNDISTRAVTFEQGNGSPYKLGEVRETDRSAGVSGTTERYSPVSAPRVWFEDSSDQFSDQPDKCHTNANKGAHSLTRPSQVYDDELLSSVKARITHIEQSTAQGTRPTIGIKPVINNANVLRNNFKPFAPFLPPTGLRFEDSKMEIVGTKGGNVTSSDSEDREQVNDYYDQQSQLKNISFSEENEDSFVLVLDHSHFSDGSQNDTSSDQAKRDGPYYVTNNFTNGTDTTANTYMHNNVDDGHYPSSNFNGEPNPSYTFEPGLDCASVNYGKGGAHENSFTERRPRILKLKTETQVRLSTEEFYKNAVPPSRAGEPNENLSNGHLPKQQHPRSSHLTNGHDHKVKEAGEDRSQKISSYQAIWSRTKLDHSESSDEILSQISAGANHHNPATQPLAAARVSGDAVNYYPDTVYAREEYTQPPTNTDLNGRQLGRMNGASATNYKEDLDDNGGLIHTPYDSNQSQPQNDCTKFKKAETYENSRTNRINSSSRYETPV